MLILEKKLWHTSQTYFVIQPRKQELSEIDYNLLPEDDNNIDNIFHTWEMVEKFKKNKKKYD